MRALKFVFYSPAARVNEQDYYSYYEFLKDLTEHFDERAGETLQKLSSLLGVFFENSKYLLAYSCEEEDKAQVLAMEKTKRRFWQWQKNLQLCCRSLKQQAVP